MLSVTPSSSAPVFDCLSDEAVYKYALDHGFYNPDEEAAAAFLHLSDDFGPGGGERVEERNGDVRKLNHSASERERRKKINELYTSLRSLLPASQQLRRMSIPTTISKMLKYIPELQEEVVRMQKRKQAISKKINKVQEQVYSSPPYIHTGASLHSQESVSHASSVSTSKVGDREVVIQISTIQVTEFMILSSLEADGFQLISASSSETLHGRVILNLHLQKLFGVQKRGCGELDENIRSILEKNGR